MSTQTKYLLAYNRFCLYFYKMFFTKLQKSGKRLMKMDKAAFLSATPHTGNPCQGSSLLDVCWMSDLGPSPFFVPDCIFIFNHIVTKFRMLGGRDTGPLLPSLQR